MVFRPEWISYGDQWPQSVITFTSVDPAGVSENESSDSDYNTVVTTGKDLLTGRIYVLDYFHERCSASECVQAIFDHARRWKPVKVKIEAIGYQSTLAGWVRERMIKEGFYFLVEPCTHHSAPKPARIRSLQPFFAAGMIILRPFMQALANELLAFPFGKHDDIIDALSMQLDMWYATRVAKREIQRSYDDDPMSVDAAAASLRESRHRSMSRVMDVGQVRDVLVLN
jgi:predicted phage terminase large subunit-like protein